MAESEVQICNNALIKIGAETIISFSDDSPSAIVCNTMYTIVRDGLLRAHIWNFALARVELAQLVTAPVFQFTHAYQLPSDCLRVIRLRDTRVKYVIEGRRLLTDASTVKLVYLKRVTDVSQYDTSFSELLALKLAAEISYSITKSISFTQGLITVFDNDFRRAKMIDAQEDGGNKIEATTLIDSRFDSNLSSADVIFED